MDEPSLDGQTAQRLGLFAYNVARKFFPYRADLVEETVQETLTRACERWERANQRGKPEAWVVNTATTSVRRSCGRSTEAPAAPRISRCPGMRKMHSWAPRSSPTRSANSRGGSAW